MESEYPEHEKVKAISDKSIDIGEFLEWLHYTKKLELALWDQTENEYFVYRYSTSVLLAEYFKIDLKKFEAEKEHMLTQLRLQNQNNK